MKQLWMLSFRVLAVAAASCLLAPEIQAQEGKTKPAAAKPADPFAKWEKEIAGIEAADAKNPPPKGEVLFIGSSTIRMWKSLAADYPDHKVINHGFGGSEIADATHFADRLIFPVEPRVIFLRSGGNDIHNGKSPQQVLEDYKQFVSTVHAKLPQTQIVYIGLAPTIARIKEVDKGNELMALIKTFTATNPKLKFIDTADTTPGPDGKPRADLFIADGLHFNDAGYKILAERVRPFMPPAGRKAEK
ncbi:MAG TPA: GDSL-type esterase/lipase family protein [Verrucomicrobiales bacterium]|jgi:lysophospholipase L1-like esterase|nr:GDSL-type esterase/lipase family protein [Verrucomicrobiales bacterium]